VCDNWSLPEDTANATFISMFHNKLYNHLELHWVIKYNFKPLQSPDLSHCLGITLKMAPDKPAQNVKTTTPMKNYSIS